MEYTVNRYAELILLENQKQNLVSRKNPVLEVAKHVRDSMEAIKLIEFSCQRVIDIGSGAGFPGMVLAIMKPDCHVTLLESDQKKSEFLQSMVEELELKNVEVLKERAEVAGRDPKRRGMYEVATSRAVASAAVLVEYALPFLKIGGRLLMWKSVNYQNEIQEAQHALEMLGGEVTEVYNYCLMEGLDRSLVVVEKRKETPDKYPRRTGIPGKRPL
ncbi:MAG: 16S rRNA (guanine(527)-N(7))-methyltransferase RsmG [Syntrophomonadaceae bacterium]